MNTTPNSQIPPDILADAQIVAECGAAGKPIPSEVSRRVREEAQQITARFEREYGQLDIGVPAIRELRGELPE